MTASIPRSSGILLHITSLPTPYGIGDLGPAAHKWIDLLAASSQTLWQILPLNPPAAGNSPYQCFSAFAGNPLLVSPDALVQDGFLMPVNLPPAAPANDHVNFSLATKNKRGMLTRTWEKFRRSRNSSYADSFTHFCRQQSSWLDDYSLFMALREANRNAPWQTWARDIARRKTLAIKNARRELSAAIQRQQFFQYLFFTQVKKLRVHAKSRNISLIGDLPIFVSLESADVWANPHLFQLDKNLRPQATAGVPPDQFSAKGQSWGNPLYNWPAMERENFAWWTRRLRAALDLTDIVRIDHFRGFEAYWRIPVGSASARNGKWVKAPGASLFSKLRQELKHLPVIAEDLGIITPEVERLRDEFNLPGMRVLQFAFDGNPQNPHLPHNHPRNSVAYTATHDNDTTLGWYSKLDPLTKKNFQNYSPPPKQKTSIAWQLIRMAWASASQRAIVPAQDLLNLGVDSRMNYPGKKTANWRWCLPDFQICKEPLTRLKNLTHIYGRECKT